MQAWNSVKVVNNDSQYAGRAGYVVRAEKKGDAQIIEVHLDETSDGIKSEVVAFDASELVML
jgi:hypothetical protein